jgi:5-methylcytosine-specific restriction protein A
MPYRPPRSCSHPGCPELTTTGGPCPAHKAEDGRSYPRSPESAQRKRIYNSRRWAGLRRVVLREQPFCAVDGCWRVATDVDHIVALADLDGDPFDRANAQALCKQHHSEKTRAEVTERARRRRTG